MKAKAFSNSKPQNDDGASEDSKPFARPILFFVSHVESLAFALAQQDAVVLATSNWRVEQLSIAANRSVIQIENLITPPQAGICDDLIYNITRGWYCHNGRDFTRSDGLSLGMIHEEDLVNGQTYSTEAFTATGGVTVFVKAVLQFSLLLRQEKPAIVRHDIDAASPLAALQMVARQLQIPLEQLPLQQLPLQQLPRAASPQASSPQALLPEALSPATCDSGALRLKRAAGTARRIAGRAVRNLRAEWRNATRASHRKRGAAQSQVLLVPYHCLDRLTRVLGERGHTVLRCDLLFAESLGFRLRRASRNRHRSVRAAWEKVRADSQYRRRFQLFDIECFGFFDSLFSDLVRHEFLKTLEQAELLEEYFNRNAIRAVVVPFDGVSFARLCVVTARRLGIGTVVTQHGLYGYGKHFRELFTAEHVCVMDDYDRAEMDRIKPDAQVHIAGCLQLDEYAPRLIVAEHEEEPGAEEQSAPRVLNVLVGTYAVTGGSAAMSSIAPEIFLKEIIAGLDAAWEQSSGRLRVTFKLHPAEKRARYEAALQLLPPRFEYCVVDGYGLPPLLLQCDLLVSPFSTAAIESLFLGKPVLAFDVPHLMDNTPRTLESCGVPTAHGWEALARTVAGAARDYPGFLDTYDFAGAMHQFGPLDGRAAQRLALVVESVMAQTPASGSATSRA